MRLGGRTRDHASCRLDGSRRRTGACATAPRCSADLRSFLGRNSLLAARNGPRRRPCQLRRVRIPTASPALPLRRRLPCLESHLRCQCRPGAVHDSGRALRFPPCPCRRVQLQGLVVQDAACLVRHLCASRRAGRVSWNVLDTSTTEGTPMKHRTGIRMLLVGSGAGIAAGLIWKLAEPEFSVPSLLRGGAWALAVLSCGLAWLLIEYGRDRRRALRSRLRQLRQIDGGGR